MAQKNRADLQIVIDTNLPDNTTDLITPVGHREVEEDLKDSNFNKIDDTAFDVNYQPTIPLDWNIQPTQVKGGLDELAQRLRDFETNNASQFVAYVGTNGSDVIGEFELGNEMKPFATFNAAIAALPSKNWRLISLGGIFTQDINIGASGAITDFTVDLRNTKINGKITGGADRGLINLHGGWVAHTGSGYAVNVGDASTVYPVAVVGGLIQATTGDGVFLNDACYIQNCVILAPSGRGITNSSNEAFNNTFVDHCRIESNLGIQGHNFKITNTKVVSVLSALFTSGSTSVANNSTFITTGAGETTIRGANRISVYMTDCYVKSEQGRALDIMRDGTTATNCFVQNSILDGATDCIQLGTLSSPIASGIDYVFKDCTMYAGTGEIILNATSVQLGNLRSINNTYNKTYIPTNNIVEYNKTEIVGLQAPVVEI